MIIDDHNSEFKLHIITQADYTATHTQMLNRTLERIQQQKQASRIDALNITTPSTIDELWLVEHNDVYTLGQASKPEHILNRNNTPIIKTDRGGQVTWHGKGQLVVYWLFDLNALNWKVRDLVSHAEQAIEDVVNAYLTQSQYYAKARSDAPGVYIYTHHNQSNLSNGDIMLGKIASLGFKIKQGFCYHGIALNIDCDLSAFSAINPCGYAGMQMLRLQDFIATSTAKNTNKSDNHNMLFNEVANALVVNIARRHRGEIKLRSIG